MTDQPPPRRGRCECPKCARRDRALIPRRASTVQTRLGAREISLAPRDRHLHHFRSIPPRLTIPIERVVDRDRKMLSCVLLGFLADGDHLVSYSTRDDGGGGDLQLQIWTFRPGRRAELLATSPLFESDGGDFRQSWWERMRWTGETAAPRAEFGEMGPETHMRVSVCESWDRKTLVVHGELGDRGHDGNRRARKCCVTVLPSPAAVPRGTPIAATHMTYVSAAESPFHPSWSGVTPAATPRECTLELGDDGRGHEQGDEDPYAFDESERGLRHRVKKQKTAAEREVMDGGKFTLNTGDALFTVDISTATLNPREPHDRALMEAQLQENIGAHVSVVPPCHSPLVTWHGCKTYDSGVGEDDVYLEDQGAFGDASPWIFVSTLPPSVRMCIITPWIALEMDKVLNSSLRAALDFGFSIRDYELLPLQYGLSSKDGEEPSMLVACLSVLEPSSWSHKPTCPGTMRVVVTVIDRQLDRTPGGGTVVYSHELPVLKAGRQSTRQLIHSARQHVMEVRRSIVIPTARWTRNASSMSNNYAVTCGLSVPVIRHSTLPICIVGYGASALRRS